MLDRPWIRLVLGVLAAAALGALAARVAGSVPGPQEPSSAAASAERRGGGEAEHGTSSGASGRGAGAPGAVEVTGGSSQLTVHVTGAVRRPGVYRLREGARIFEAVRKAGGATSRADRQRLNLAAAVRDGQQVLVPERAAPAGSGVRGAGGGAGSASGGGGGGSGAAAAGGGTPIDLNTAGVEELQGLEGVGPTTAEKIVRLREQRGGLGGVDDLDEVPGIGPKKLDALRAQLEP